MNGRRVVITGIGVISPLGSGDKFWDNLVNGKSGIRRLTKFDTTDFECKIGGEAEFNYRDYGIDDKEARRMDPFSQYGVGAFKLALEDSGLDLEKEDKDKIGIIIGTGIGGLKTFEVEKEKLIEKGPRRVSPLMVPMVMSNAVCAHITMKYNITGPSFSVNSACASGLHAIISAYKDIKIGCADISITGGTEATMTPVSYSSFTNARAMTKKFNDSPEKASRPFDAMRDGFVMGEGAGIIILEELEHAKKRNAKIYAEILGYGMTSDAYHITAPDENGEGARKAMELALKTAGINPEDINYINAHGTSTPLNDKIESLAIRNLFKEHSDKKKGRLAVSSTKSMTGHLIGAAGGLETVICTLAIDRQFIPPTINYEFEDKELKEYNLDYVPNEARESKIETVMNNSFGFGGHNAVIILRKYKTGWGVFQDAVKSIYRRCFSKI